MNIERAQTLANFLRTVKPSQFDMNHWYHEKRWPCNTTACAGGWACMIDEFQRKGLTLNSTKDPSYKSDTGYEALMRFFNLDDNICIRWFYINTFFKRATPSDVADRIEKDIAWYLKQQQQRDYDPMVQTAQAEAEKALVKMTTT